MDDGFDDDADFAAALDAHERSHKPPDPAPGPQKVQQLKPQALPNRQMQSSIIVSPKQKGNPVLNGIRAVPWEYGDIVPDFVMGNTTCGLFLSLKYHRLHPEYIYGRIKELGHKYNLRVLLVLVDIEAHEESLKELTKTGLVNDLTIILSWSAAEVGRYLELYKGFENAPPTAIQAYQATSYQERVKEFITVPRSINKTNALSLLDEFGSLRNAINADPEDVATIMGWGEIKVKQWCEIVREPFKRQKVTKRGADRTEMGENDTPDDDGDDDEDQLLLDTGRAQKQKSAPVSQVPQVPFKENNLWEPGDDEEEALHELEGRNPTDEDQRRSTKRKEGELTSGIEAALAKLRENG